MSTKRTILAAAAAILVAAGAAQLAARLADDRRDWFESCEDFCAYAKARGMYYHSGQKHHPHNPFAGAYLSRGPVGYDDVCGLSKGRSARWQGVIWCENTKSHPPVNVPYRLCGNIRLIGDESVMSELVP